EHEPHRLLGDLLQRRLDLGGERSELVVDHHHAVVARANADIASLALEHPQVRRDRGGLDLDLREVRRLREREGGDEQGGGGEQAGHTSVPPSQGGAPSIEQPELWRWKISGSNPRTERRITKVRNEEDRGTSPIGSSSRGETSLCQTPLASLVRTREESTA